MMPYNPSTFAVSVLLLVGTYAMARTGGDSLRTLGYPLFVVLVTAVIVTVAGVGSFPLSSAQLGLPVVAGVVLGSWPDATNRWPARLRAGLRGIPESLPDVSAVIVALLVGVWAWGAS